MSFSSLTQRGVHNVTSRATAECLVEHNRRQRADRQTACGGPHEPGDTSQNGKWDNFRNIMINDVRVDTLETVPASGMVELDYVSPVRPKPDAEPLHPARLLRLVQRMRLVPRVRRAAKAPAVTQSEVDKRKYELGQMMLLQPWPVHAQPI